MTLHAQKDRGIPDETKRVAHAAFPNGNDYMDLRDGLGLFYTDSDFAALFPARGRAAESPGILAMVSVFQIIENFSDRQAADAVRARIDWKYALGLELADPGFNYSVLSEFRGRVIQGGMEQKLLDNFLIKFKELKLLKTRGHQRTDSTYVLAVTRRLNRLELAGETFRSALNALSKVAPDWMRDLALADWRERYKMRFDLYRWPKSKAEQEKLALIIGQDGSYLLDAVYQSNTPAEVRNHPAIEILRQVWVQQFSIKDGRVQWRESKDMPSAERLIQSPYDPEARFSRKRDIEWTGYKVHMTETCDTALHVVTHVATTSATRPDQSMTYSIHTALKNKELLPQKHFVDAGYVDAELIVNSRKDFDIDLFGPVPSDTSWQAEKGEGFDLGSFQINWEQETVKCPQGKSSRGWSSSHDSFSNPVINVQFNKQDCQMCSVRSKCTKARHGPRTLKLRPRAEHEALQYARKRQDTQEFKEKYATRSGVEGTISQGIRTCGMCNARYIGLAKTNFQNILAAAAMNLVRFADWLNEIPHAATRTCAFAKLCPE